MSSYICIKRFELSKKFIDERPIPKTYTVLKKYVFAIYTEYDEVYVNFFNFIINNFLILCVAFVNFFMP